MSDPWTRERVLAAYQDSGNFSHQNLSYLDLSNLDLYWADFSHANLCETTLAGTVLLNATFGYANLEYTNFHGAHLQLATFRHAYLYANDFDEAKLPLSDHDLIGALLFRAASNDKPGQLMVASMVSALDSWCWANFYAYFKQVLTPDDQQWVRDVFKRYKALDAHLAEVEAGKIYGDIPF